MQISGEGQPEKQKGDTMKQRGIGKHHARLRRAFLTCWILVFLPPLVGQEIADYQSDEIISRIRRKSAIIYQKYKGVECRRTIISKQYDDRTGAEVGGYEAVLLRKEYFYQKAKNEVLSFSPYGKMSVPRRFLFQTRPPIHPPFDANADTNYRLRVTGKKRIQGKECWEIAVTPLKKTYRHLAGSAYFTVQELDLLCLAGTVADLPTGVKSLSMEVFFKKLDDAYVIDRGTYAFTIHIPIFFPHRRLVQTFTSCEDRLIPAHE